MIYVTLILAAGLVVVAYLLYRDFKKGAQSPTQVAYKLEPPPAGTITVANPVDAVIPTTSQVPSTLAYYDPNRVMVQPGVTVVSTDLSKDGAGPHHPGGYAVYAIPDLPAGLATFAIADVYQGPVNVVISGPETLLNETFEVANERRLKVSVPGHYEAKVSGGACVVKVMSRGK